MKRYFFPLAILFSLSTQYSYAGNQKIKVTLIPAKGVEAQGNVTFQQLPKDKGVKIIGSIEHLTPGKHGMHVHAIGDCSDPENGFKKSMGHFDDGYKHKHGSLSDGHSGDLGNIVADKNGEAQFTIVTDKFDLSKEGDKSILGKAILIHAGMDDEKTDPAGNSGARILCGVVKK